MDSDLLLENVVSTAKLAKRFGLPIVHSTVGVAAGQDTRDPLCPVRSRPIRNTATGIQLSGRRLQP